MKNELLSYVNLFKQEGTSQAERYPPMLDPASVMVDPRRLEDFIIYAQRYTREVLFIPANQDPADPSITWSKLFKDNSILLAAYIATVDVEEIKELFDSLSDEFRDESSLGRFYKILDLVLGRFKKLDDWYASSDLSGPISQDIYLYIRSVLAREYIRLQGIISYFNNLLRGNKVLVPFDTGLKNVDGVWDIPGPQNPLLADNIYAGNSESEKLNNALLYINKLFDSVYHVTANIVASSKSFFNESIYKQQSLSPHLALYIAFIHLYQVQQHELNKLPARLLDFYYKDVLKIRPGKADPDQAYVLFELTKGFDNVKVSRGTELQAGKDKRKADLIYTTDKDIIVNKAGISSLKTVYISSKDGLVTGFLKNIIKKDESFMDPSAGEPGYNWKAFGSPVQGTPFDIGFAIASNQLYLAKGERTINLTVETTSELAIPGGDTIDNSILEVLFTGEKGWISSIVSGINNGNDVIRINHFKKTEAKKLELNCTIPIALPSAVIAFDSNVHEGGLATDMPVMQLVLHFPPPPSGREVDNSYAIKLQQANFLCSLSIASMVIRVQVGSFDLKKASFDGVRDLVVQNHDAVLDPHKPFFPFTALPRVGSSFYIGGDDLYYKQIQKLAINIEWMLPDNFDNYYNNYFPPYNSNRFMASLSILKDQYWSKLKDIPVINANDVAPSFRTINVPISETASPPVADENEVSKFDLTKKNGTLKLKLNYPDFGHEVYPQLITSVVMEKAASKQGTADFNSIIKKELDDAVISIKIPPPGDPSNNIPKVMNALKVDGIGQQQLRVMITAPIEDSLVRFNQVPSTSDDMQQQLAAESTTVVNDTNFVERILRFLRTVRLISANVHYDRNKDTVTTVVENVSEHISKRASFILPADQEMVTLIFNEVRNAISRLVLKTADKVIEARRTKIPTDSDVLAMLQKEVDDANEVINDMVAKKIATLLSANDVPPKPYTPLINTIALSYESEKILSPGEDQYFHLLPFGFVQTTPFNRVNTGLTPERSTATHRMFANSITAFVEKSKVPEGFLFIGLKQVEPNENITLLFRMDQATRSTDIKPPMVQWSYLNNNDWIKFGTDDIISDSTYGLQTTGVLELAIPAKIVARNTHFEEQELCWLCAAVSDGTRSFPDLIDIHTQAVQVTFKNNNNDPGRLSMPLPAGKINKLADGLAGIKSIRQPVPSFNGKVGELESEYYRRVSERLRHKSRAVNNWDYERLVLEHFPFVYKVKCLNDYYMGKFLPRHVTIVPIVGSRNKAEETTQLAEIPKASYLELKKIEDFLRKRSSPFVKIHVMNPQPEYILVNCKVRFKTGVDKGYFLKKLNGDIVAFLTPWAMQPDQVSYSTKVYASTLISFIDKLTYVDFVADLSMNQYALAEDGQITYRRLENQMIALTETQIASAHSILVSAPDHHIEMI